MTRVIIVVYALEGSPKIEYAKRTLLNVFTNSDFNNHELFISDNGSCTEMHEFYELLRLLFDAKFPSENLTIQFNGKNLGTSGALNLGIKTRKPNQYVIKRDDDTVVEDDKWIEKMEECFERFDNLGILGLKRNDLIQHPDHENKDYRTEIKYLKHEIGQTWIPIELCKDIMGTLTMFSPKLLDTLGYSYQPNIYGYEDVLFCIRSLKAGFVNAFLPTIPIDHIDTGEGEFTKWKQDHAKESWEDFQEIAQDYISGVRDVYHNPYE